MGSNKTLIDENHAELVKLSVSHPSLETIRAITLAEPFGLSTKLTGAGGGGCAVTLVPDGARIFFFTLKELFSEFAFSGFEQSKLKQLSTDLTTANFEPYFTSVGGSGLGILSPHTQRPNPRQDSPPMTPNHESDDEHQEDKSGLLAGFKSSEVAGLSEWAEARGMWLYV